MGRQISVILHTRIERSISDVSYLLPYIPQVFNIKIYLIFEKYEQTKI